MGQDTSAKLKQQGLFELPSAAFIGMQPVFGLMDEIATLSSRARDDKKGAPCVALSAKRSSSRTDGPSSF